MNVRRFTARTSRDALGLVREALGDDAVVLSTKPCVDGVEVLAMAPEGMRQVEKYSGSPSDESGFAHSRMDMPLEAPLEAGADEDAARLEMSTLSFQDYVRTRMLKRRQAALNTTTPAAPMRASSSRGVEGDAVAHLLATQNLAQSALRAAETTRSSGVLEQRMTERGASTASTASIQQTSAAGASTPTVRARPHVSLHDAADLHESTQRSPETRQEARHGSRHEARQDARDDSRDDTRHEAGADPAARRDQQDMMNELRSMRGLIEERFGALAFMEKLQRHPAQARLTQKLLDCGFSPALIRKIGDSLSVDTVDETAWAASVLERNLLTGEAESAIEDQGGVYALVGATGVGKTTTTAKIAAAFATQYGASNLGLITLDAYRVGAHEQLRAYGRILGVPVHTAHDRASLDDLLELLAGKKMVLIDTAGMAQRDSRTRELLDMLSHRSIQKLLVVNAASQGETIEDVLNSYRASTCRAIVLSKMDEAVKLGPAIDAMIRHKVRVIGVANGQRVPEDWHRLSASALVQRALRSGGSSAYRLDADDMNLIFTAPRPQAPALDAAAA